MERIYACLSQEAEGGVPKLLPLIFLDHRASPVKAWPLTVGMRLPNASTETCAHPAKECVLLMQPAEMIMKRQLFGTTI